MWEKDRDSGGTSLRASKWPDLMATAPGLPSTSSIDEGLGPARQINRGRICRAFFSKERMLSQAECERPVTGGTEGREQGNEGTRNDGLRD